MTIDELLAQMEHKSPPAPADKLAEFEKLLGHTLPGYVYRAARWP